MTTFTAFLIMPLLIAVLSEFKFQQRWKHVIRKGLSDQVFISHVLKGDSHAGSIYPSSLPNTGEGTVMPGQYTPPLFLILERGQSCRVNIPLLSS